MDAFKKITGLNIKSMPYSRGNHKKWDDWLRDQVTLTVSAISERIRTVSPRSKISCTIVPSIERTYLVTLQDWTAWLNRGLIDYVVAMNYTDDTKLLKQNAISLLALKNDNKVHMGIGAYLLKENPKTLEDEIEILRDLPTGGIVLFSYDEVANNENLQKFLDSRFRGNDSE